MIRPERCVQRVELRVGLLLGIMCLVFAIRSLHAEERLIDQAPHDLLTLKQGGGTFKLVPLKMQPRAPLRERDRDEWLQVRLLNRPSQQYQVRWRDIERVQLFEELVMEEADRLIAADDFDEAHACYRYIEGWSPGFSGLDIARRRCLFHEAGFWLRQARYAHALGLLNELFAADPRFSGLQEVIGRVVDRLVEQFLATGKYAAARVLLDELAVKYPRHEVVETRQRQLIKLCEQTYQQARRANSEGALREAHELVRKARSIWPASEAVRELTAELNRKYPVIRVGVRSSWSGLSRAGELLAAPDNWADRRCQMLVDRRLFVPQSFGPQGGVYQSDLVTCEAKGQVLTCRIQEGVRWPGGTRPLTSVDLSRQLASQIDAGKRLGNMQLAASMESIRVVDAKSLKIAWRAPLGIWQALLSIPVRWCVGDGELRKANPLSGAYEALRQDDGVWRFMLRKDAYAATSRQPREISEAMYVDTLSALQALRSEEIHAYDRIVPWDVGRVRAYAELRLVPYAVPTVHLLIPNPNSPLMAVGNVRRAISLALDRERILRDVLGDGTTAAGKSLSGPFPTGYAYDDSVELPARNARLAAALLQDARQRADAGTLKLVYAPDPVVRRAARAVQDELALDGLGLETELVEIQNARLADGPAGQWDLWYVEWHAMEPAVDAAALLGPASIVGRGDPLLKSVVQQLAAAGTWDELQSQLHRVHQVVTRQMAIIPLWQLDEFAVVRQACEGVGKQPVTLYSNIQQWQVKLK